VLESFDFPTLPVDVSSPVVKKETVIFGVRKNIVDCHRRGYSGAGYSEQHVCASGGRFPRDLSYHKRLADHLERQLADTFAIGVSPTAASRVSRRKVNV